MRNRGRSYLHGDTGVGKELRHVFFHFRRCHTLWVRTADITIGDTATLDVEQVTQSIGIASEIQEAELLDLSRNQI